MMASHPLLWRSTKIENNVNMIIGRNKGKHPGHVNHHNFYFVALLVLLV